MAFTQAEIDALRAAIASGVRTVAFADRSVTYHSLAEMLQALAVMESAVNATRTHRVAAVDKGL